MLFVMLLLACSMEVPERPGAPSFLSEARTLLPPAFSGTVTEVLQVPGYTYVSVESGEITQWVVALHRTVDVGEHIDVRPFGELSSFHSKSLERTFDRVVFATFHTSNRSSP